LTDVFISLRRDLDAARAQEKFLHAELREVNQREELRARSLNAELDAARAERDEFERRLNDPKARWVERSYLDAARAEVAEMRAGWQEMERSSSRAMYGEQQEALRATRAEAMVDDMVGVVGYMEAQAGELRARARELAEALGGLMDRAASNGVGWPVEWTAVLNRAREVLGDA
jgi:hypothetical protein